jgi:hypothetical protein
MNKLIYLLYFTILIVFLIIIKKMIFNKEMFHALDNEPIGDPQPPVNVVPAPPAAPDPAPDPDPVADPAGQPPAAAPPAAAPPAADPEEVPPQELTDPVADPAGQPPAAAPPAADPEEVPPQELTDPVSTSSSNGVETQPPPVQVPPLPNVIEVAPKLTVQNDTECCGVAVFETKLDPIGKCITQHIKQTGEQHDPKFVEWQDSDNDCKNPHNILSITSNCNEIVNKYDKNIQTLLSVIKKSGCAKCDYFRYLQNPDSVEDDQLTSNEKMGVFQKKIRCDILGKFERGTDIHQIGTDENVKFEIEVPECITPENP